MRITGGLARGIVLKTPSEGLRPATDKSREAIFSSLGDLVPESRVLDLFAGSGSYGLEAFSRGARLVRFIEKNGRILAALRENLDAVARSAERNAAECTVSAMDVFSWKPAPGEQFDIIFADPPYPLYPACGPRIIELAAACLAPAGRLVMEMPGEYRPPETPLPLLRRLGKSGRGEPSLGIFGIPDR